MKSVWVLLMLISSVLPAQRNVEAVKDSQGRLKLVYKDSEAGVVPPRFSDGFQSEQNGISVGIAYARTNPRCLHYDNCEWTISWGAKHRAERATIEALFLDSSGEIQHDMQFVPASTKALPALHNPRFKTPLGVIVSIRFTLYSSAGRVVARAEFKPDPVP